MALDRLGQVLHQLEAQPRWQTQYQFRQVLDRWQTIVGEGVARHTQPLRIDRGLLYVAVSNPTWSQTLTFERLRILKKLNHTVMPPLRDIRFSPGDWSRANRHRQGNSAVLSARELLEQMRSHPSFDVSRQSMASAPNPPTADAAFRQWAEHLQSSRRHQPLCPQCGCHCPRGELQRWGQCGLCAAKTWH